jgi:hypothetical protein
MLMAQSNSSNANYEPVNYPFTQEKHSEIESFQSMVNDLGGAKDFVYNLEATEKIAEDRCKSHRKPQLELKDKLAIRGYSELESPMGDDLHIWGLRRDQTNSAHIRELINSARDSGVKVVGRNIDFKEKKFIASLVDSFTQNNSPLRHEEGSSGEFQHGNVHKFNIQAESSDNLPDEVLMNLESSDPEADFPPTYQILVKPDTPSIPRNPPPKSLANYAKRPSCP